MNDWVRRKTGEKIIEMSVSGDRRDDPLKRF
jgi:hypothetical protein